MVVRIVKKSWWIDFRFNHTRYRKRSPDNSRAGALAYEALMRQKLARGELLDPRDKSDSTDEMTFGQFAGRWFEHYVRANNKPSEQYSKEKILKSHLIPFFGPMRLDEIATERVEKFKAEQIKKGVSNKTINNRLTVLGRCMNCAHEWHGAPAPRIRLLKTAPPKTDYLTPGECELLLDNATGQMRTMILLALRTGMRQGEIRGLQWSSIDWQNRDIVVRHSWSDVLSTTKMLVAPKSNRERYIPLDAEVYDLLYQNRKKSGFVFLTPYGEPFTSHRFIYDLEKTCKNADVRKIGWHVLRHTFATRLATMGVPLSTVQALLGHSTISTTMRYAHVAPSTLRAAINMLNPKLVLSPSSSQPVVNQWQEAMRSEIVKLDE